MHTDTHTSTAEEHEDHGDHYKPLTVAELDRLLHESLATDDYFKGQKMALRVFRAAPHPREAEKARVAFKALVNAMQGRDENGDVVGSLSEAYVVARRNELLALLGVAQGELLSPSPVGYGRIADSQSQITKLREQAARLRERAGGLVHDAHWSDAPGAVQLAREDAAELERQAVKLDAQVAELEAKEGK